MDTTIRRPRRRRHSRPGLERLEARSLLSVAGSIDPSFNDGLGFATLPISSATFYPPAASYQTAEAVQSDGKIVVVGTGTSDGSSRTTFLIARFNADGSPDAGFGTGGRVVIPFNNLATATAVAIQPDGKIVAGGTLVESAPIDGQTSQFDFAAVRLNADGSPDAGFGTGGTVHFAVGGPVPPFPSSNTYGLAAVKSVLVQADGSIVLAGNAEAGDSSMVDFAAARLTPSGHLDATFGAAGVSLIPVAYANGVGVQSDIAAGAAITAGGQVVLAGTVSYPGGIDIVPYPGRGLIGVVRLNADGSLDTSFGSTDLPGVAHPFAPKADYNTGVSKSINAMALQADGKLVLAGDGFSAIRLNADGSVDTAFGAGGEVTNADARNASALNVAIDPAGNIAVLGLLSTGTTQYSGAYALQLGRFTPAGVVDPTFGDPSTPGLTDQLFPAAGTEHEPGVTFGTALGIAGDGNLVLAATPNVFNYTPTLLTIQNYILVSRVLSTSTTSTPVLQQAPASYDASGKTNPAVYLPTPGALAYRPANGAPDVILPFGGPGAGQVLPAPGDYDGIGHTEIAAYLTGPGYYAIRDTSTGTDRAFQFGTPGVGNTLPAPGDYEGTGRSDVAVYLADTGSFAILPADGSPGRIIQFGPAGVGNSIPAPADYFGTGHDDLAVYLTRAGGFAVADPSGQHPAVFVPFGAPGSGAIPVPGDYDGSGHVELAVYIPAYAAFFYRPFGGGPDLAVKLGTPGVGDLPAVGDYDGSGQDEFAVYDPTSGSFTYLPAGGGPAVVVPFGSAGPGQSLPVATPPGALPGFGGTPNVGGGGNAIRLAFLGPAPSTATPPARAASTSSPAVPGGPAVASRRVALGPVRQAAPDPLDRLA